MPGSYPTPSVQVEWRLQPFCSAQHVVALIGKIGSASQGVSYFEKDGYYAKDDRVPWKGTTTQRVARPARQLSLQPVAIGAGYRGNDVA